MQEFLINNTKKRIYIAYFLKKKRNTNEKYSGQIFPMCSLWQLAFGYSTLNIITNLKSVMYATKLKCSYIGGLFYYQFHEMKYKISKLKFLLFEHVSPTLCSVSSQDTSRDGDRISGAKETSPNGTSNGNVEFESGAGRWQRRTSSI